MDQRLVLRLETPWFAAANLAAGAFSSIRLVLDDAAGQHAEDARRYSANGNDERALIEYERALIRAPGSPSILMEAGQLAHRMGRYDHAIRWYRKALDLDYRDGRSIKGLAFALHGAGETDEAIYRYYRYLDANGGDYDALLNLSALFMDSARYAEAIEYSERAASVRPNASAPYYNIALANFNIGKFEMAEEKIRRAIDIEPSADSYCLYGYFLETHEQFAKALAQYELAIKSDPDLGDVWLDIARQHQKLNRPADYLNAAQNAVTLFERNGADPRDLSRAYWDLGWAYYENGELEKSVDASRKAVAHTPEASAARFNLGLALLAMGKTDEARQQYQTALKHSRRSDIKGDGIDDLEVLLRKNPAIEGGREILNALLAEYNKFNVHHPTRSLTSPRAM